MLTPANRVESTLAVAFVQGTSTEIALASVANCPAKSVVYMNDAVEWCLVKYGLLDTPNKKLKTLTNPLAVYQSSGATGHEFPIGTKVCIVAAADLVEQLLLKTATDKTIAAGVIAVDSTRPIAAYLVDTEAGAATDDLDTITGGAEGMLILLRAKDAAHTVVAKHSTGNLLTAGADISLDDTYLYILLAYDTALVKWVVVGGGGGGGVQTPWASNINAAGYNLTNLGYAALQAGGRLLGQAGNAAWENRSYEGWELVNTETTYTIGAVQDFATLGAAAAALQGLIMAEDIILDVVDNQVLTADVVFKNLLSAGGRLKIDLADTKSINIDDGCTHGIQAVGPFVLYIDGDATGDITMVAGSLDPPYRALYIQDGCLLWLRNVTIDANNKAATTMVQFSKALGYFNVPNWLNGGNLSSAFVTAAENTRVGIRTGTPTLSVTFGALVVNANGTIVTSGGTLTPTP